ncbi:MAG: DUF1439 domain-containing protein [Verrucomicrobiales bacterium]|nr:DUF1439 domain-containing protein [Verrucomicrobiales bacterium]
MKRIIWLSGLTLALCVAGMVSWFASGQTVKLSIPREEIEANAQKFFPIHRGVVKFDLVESRLDCVPAENRLIISGGLKIEVLGLINASGTCRVSGEPQYNPDTRSIQLKDVRIEKLTLDGMPQKIHRQVQELGGKALEAFLGEFSFYKFDRHNRWQKFLADHVRAIAVGEDALMLTIGK